MSISWHNDGIGDDVALLPFLLVLLLAAVLASTVVHARRTAPSRETAVAAARRHAGLTAAAALVAAALAGLGAAVTGLGLFTGPGDLGRSLLLAPLAAATAHSVVLLVGELTWPRPRADVRRAQLTRRGLLDAAPHWLLRLAAAIPAALVVVLVVGTLTADHTGRGIAVSWASGGAAAGPYPGSFYAAPAAAGLAVLVVATTAALRVVAERPAVATEDPRIEAALRRASTHRVLRGAVAGALALLAGLLLTMGTSLHSIGADMNGTGTTLLAVVGPAIAVAAGVVALLAVLVACIPTPAVPAGDAVLTA